MVDSLAYGLPVIAVLVAAVGMFAVHHSTKVLKRKLANEPGRLAVNGEGGAHMAPAQGYGEVHVSIARSETAEA